MTRCTVYVDSTSRITGFSVKGHAGYAEEGSDIVCAGISALVTTIDQALVRLVGLKLTEREGDGLADGTIASCDYTVRIPMAHGVDSLNVAAASAVAFWQLGNR